MNKKSLFQEESAYGTPFHLEKYGRTAEQI